MGVSGDVLKSTWTKYARMYFKKNNIQTCRVVSDNNKLERVARIINNY